MGADLRDRASVCYWLFSEYTLLLVLVLIYFYCSFTFIHRDVCITTSYSPLPFSSSCSPHFSFSLSPFLPPQTPASPGCSRTGSVDQPDLELRDCLPLPPNLKACASTSRQLFFFIQVSAQNNFQNATIFFSIYHGLKGLLTYLFIQPYMLLNSRCSLSQYLLNNIYSKHSVHTHVTFS